MMLGRMGFKFYLRSTFLFLETGFGFEKAPLQKYKRCIKSDYIAECDVRDGKLIVTRSRDLNLLVYSQNILIS